jgi:hypothetical protein
MSTLYPARLPVTHGLTPIYILSLAVAGLMATASIAGIVYRAAVYPTDELVHTFLPNDVVNLLIGLPILLGSMWAAWRGRLAGLLCWPGALFFVLYNYIVYLLALPPSAAFLLHLALVALSAYTLIGLVAAIDGTAVQQALAGSVPERLAGGILAGFGLLFFLRATAVIGGAVSSGAPVAGTELAVNTSDFLITPAWVMGGILLWRRKQLGYVAALGLLFQASMLFVALLAFLLLQPFLTAAPLAAVDIAVILVMGSICFVPFALFARGVAAKRVHAQFQA